MSVAKVYGRIQSYDAALTSQEGDVWTFSVPSWVTGPVIAEFWAEDDVGNVTYRSAVLSIEGGTVKCVHLMKKHGVCTMLNVRPTVTMVQHVCPLMEVY